MLKVRIVADKRASKEEILQATIRAARTGFVPKGFRVRWIDWEKGEEGQASGRITKEVQTQLQLFLGAIQQGSIRVEAVS